MAEDLQDTIRRNAQGPKRAEGDSGSVEQHSLAEQIEADRYLASKTAATRVATRRSAARRSTRASCVAGQD